MDNGVAVWQMAPTPKDPAANLERLDAAARHARERGATVLITPELAMTGYDIGDLDEALTSTAIVGRVGEIAKSAGVTIVAGLALREDGATWNSSVIVDRFGRLRATYRKAHLFAELDRTRFAAGDAPFAMATIDGLNVATLICYDVEFPEPVRAAALAGAHLLAVPTANMVPWGAVNEYVIPTRALESHIVVAYANHCGRERDTRYVGHSVIAAPDGTIERAGSEEETVVYMAIDTEDVEQRQRDLHLVDRRPDLYGSLSEPTTP